MKFYIKVYILSIVCLEFIECQRLLRSDIRIPFRRGSFDSSVKGSQLSGVKTSRTKFTLLSPDDSNNAGFITSDRKFLQLSPEDTGYAGVYSCDNKKDYSHEVALSFKTLMIIGDRDLKLSHNDDHHQEHCDDAKKHINWFLQHVKCIEGNHKRTLQHIGDDFNKWVKKRCDDKQWHNQFIQFSKCIFDTEVERELHACNDKIYYALKFVLQNVPERYQQLSTCCIVPLAFNCVYGYTNNHCGPEIANFTLGTMFDGFLTTLVDVCNGKYDSRCGARLNAALKNIFESKVPETAFGIYEPFFTIVENSGKYLNLEKTGNYEDLLEKPTNSKYPLPVSGNGSGSSTQIYRPQDPQGISVVRGSGSGSNAEFFNRQDSQEKASTTVCDPNEEDVNGDVLQAFKAATIIGDRDLFLSEHDGHQKEHCETAKKSLKKFQDHVNCIEASHRKSIQHMADDLKRMVTNRCDSKEWHDRYIIISKCMFDAEVQENLHTCSDRIYDYFDFADKQLPPSQQRLSACCNIPRIRSCIRNTTERVCGREVANYAIDLFFEPFASIALDTCYENYRTLNPHCSPKIAAAFDKIDATKVAVRHEGFYKIMLKVLKNIHDAEGL